MKLNTHRPSTIFKTLIFMFLFLFCTSITAFAETYLYYPYGYHFATVDVDNWTYLSAPYSYPSSVAISSWNSGLTSRSVTGGPSSQNKVYANALSDQFNAIYDQLVYDTSYAQTRSYFTTKFQIIFNTNKVSGYNQTRLQGVFCHELGHALGLAHNDAMTIPATIIRSSSENLSSVYTPQTYDRNAINALWPHY